MKRLRPFLIVLLIVIVAVIAWKLLHRSKAAPRAETKPIPVTTTTVENRDVPVWLSGLGTVQAFNTVTVRPRVSGELRSINFTEGQEVKAGDILAEIDPRPYRATLDQALAKKAQDEAQSANDRRELNRIRELVASNTESRQLLDQRESSVANSNALIQASQAAVDSAKLDLDFTTVRAPISGHTGVRLLDAGNLVTASQNAGLVVITQVRPISVVFSIPQQNFLDLRQGMKTSGATELAVEALDDSNRILARGKLELIDNQIDTTTGTLRLKATFANDDQTLWPGQFVNARVLVQTIAKATTVPNEAVQPGLDGPFVYVMKADNTAEARNVKLGPSAEGVTVITDGIKTGEKIVREGQNKLQPGAKIEAAKPKSDSAKASPVAAVE